jgi:L-ribulokinase
MAYTIGLDYGTNSVRCVVVNTKNGEEIGTAVFPYPTGKEGIILDHCDANLARQNPADYIKGIEQSIKDTLKAAKKNDKKFSPEKIIGIGVDTTGSTPIPVDRNGTPLSMLDKFKKNPNATAWLWKDHTGYAEAAEITALAAKYHPEYLAKCGGTYSSEWFFSKILHCLRVDKKVFDAAYSWIECADFIPAVLVGDCKPENIKRGRCAAGHKAMFNEDWGGLPAKSFLNKLNPKIGALRDRLYKKTYTVDEAAGGLCKEWAKKLNISENIPVAVGAFDAHLGAVGSGIKQGTLVKIIGTSTCDILVSPKKGKIADTPGLCGIIDGSVLPNFWGLEAGQSAVGDIFNWFVNYIQPGGKHSGSHEELTKKAAKLKPAQSGLLALDWNNGNRTILVDQRLTGLLLGQTLHTKPEEIYRALIEATAFGALTIINRFEEYGIKIKEVVNCGGIAEKNPLLMQIYADVSGREMKVSRSAQSCALGSAIAAAVAAGKKAGGYDNFAQAQSAMCGVKNKVYIPNKKNHKVYVELYKLYKRLHDAFGVKDHRVVLSDVMKKLLELKERVN